MKYKFSKDPLFGKYCYIDTPWIAGKNTIYRIVNSGVRSNAWVEVPIRGRAEVVTHDQYEDVVYVVLDTLIDEDSRIKKVALKDIVIADTPQTEAPKRMRTFSEGGIGYTPHTISTPYCVDTSNICKVDTVQTDGYMTEKQAGDYSKMLEKAEHIIYGNIDNISQIDCGWK